MMCEIIDTLPWRKWLIILKIKWSLIEWINSCTSSSSSDPWGKAKKPRTITKVVLISRVKQSQRKPLRWLFHDQVILHWMLIDEELSLIWRMFTLVATSRSSAPCMGGHLSPCMSTCGAHR
ncbi:uncharacterized protein LOC120110737 [Phoenix dactylifera]|uniref:Uncharacterized protein LOC120110737 n=1 Tax=Phoenix dactylifera TaxID=42345 RepID=A0A8B9A6E6_PHODC|nr:uncharacterized protein LOC120110737 [Phoenix dactylifera]